MGNLTLHLLLCVFVVICTAKCPKDWAEVGNECLMFSYDRNTWSGAQAFCRSQLSYLASDDTAAKHTFIRQALSVLDGAKIKDFFIGGNDRVFEGQWRWLETGMPITKFTAWAPNSPSTNMTLAMKQNCMMLTWVDNDVYWTDHDCSDRRGHFICEKPVSSITSAPVVG
ncbi:C-type lectin domain family 17, member A-like [Mytilus galloprovincialis]|uniref:C-type lectin domain family 17, member A-like n=1 Tax=Mytilus galloprovincialis TaxID=29158 RepID=UPI003F7C5906